MVFRCFFLWWIDISAVLESSFGLGSGTWGCNKGDKFLRVFLVASVFLTLCLNGLFSSAQAKSQSDEARRAAFLEAWTVFSKERLRPIDHESSPFLPYLSPPFETGLDETDLVLFDAALRVGDPIVVQRLLVKGLLKLHPFLQPLFDQDQNKALAFDLRFVLQ